jgi:lysophospholipase L1-like esterase
MYENVGIDKTIHTLDMREELKLRRIVLVGDSITFGDNAQSRKNSWGSRLHEYLKNNFPGKFELVNNGVEGEIAQEGFDEIEDRVIKYTPDIVFIGYGTNDCTKENRAYVNSIYNFESNMKDIAEAVRSQTNAVIIFNLAPPVIEELCNDDVVTIHNRDIEAYNNVVKRICGSMMLSFVDHYDLMSANDDIKELIDYDGIHPNDEGHRVMFENILSSTGHFFV